MFLNKFFKSPFTKESTQLIKEAKKHGLATQRGHAMLVRQAAESFKIWFEEYPNEDEINCNREPNTTFSIS